VFGSSLAIDPRASRGGPPSRSCRLTLALVVALLCSAALPRAAGSVPREWPEGTDTLSFTNVDGLILVRAHLVGRPLGPERSESRPVREEVADTTGWFVVDSGSGFLAIDAQLAVRLGLIDSVPSRPVDFAERALQRFEIGHLQADQISPVAVFDAGIIRRVTGREVLGLIGYRVIRDRVLWIDYSAEQLALIPAGSEVSESDALAVAESRRIVGTALSSAAIPVRFRLTGDGKIVLQGRVTPKRGGRATPWLNLVLDTGASKSTLFEDRIDPRSHVESWRPVMRGLVAPTLEASSTARLSRVRRIEIRGTAGIATATETEVALLRNPLARQLEELAGEPIHGLLGYSFLERFRVSCDYPHRVLWLDPIQDFRDPHPLEHSQVGVQVEGIDGTLRVAAVIEDSPAARAGIAQGDVIVAVDGKSVRDVPPSEIDRLLEGPPGTVIRLTLRHGTTERTLSLRRRQLL
jgi:PDZ domain